MQIKVIVSHDVDHLKNKDHFFKDLFFPKLIIKSTLELLLHKISIAEWHYRCSKCFKEELNNIEELMLFDHKNGIPATYFFGMANGLGMSYKTKIAKEYINRVLENNFSVGLHGISYDNKFLMQQERDAFFNTMGFNPVGIRMHYVRFSENTFAYINSLGYRYDSTEFDKENGYTVKNPFKIGNLWEFPLTIMDSYLPYDFEDAKLRTIKILQEAKDNEIEYVTILHHDYLFCDAYSVYKKWYMWLISYLTDQAEYRFVSFESAIKSLEGGCYC